MKRTFTILFCLAFTASLQAGMFGSDSAIQFSVAKDTRKWMPSHTGGKMFLEGDSSKSWKEMVSVEFTDTNVSLRKYVDVWKDELLKTDSRTDIKEEAVGNDSIIVTGTSADQTRIHKFIKGKDGIYMVAYQVRSQFKKDELFRIWESIVRNASLIPSNKDQFA